MNQLASLLYGFVNFMLLRGTGQLLRRPIKMIPCLISGVLSSLYTWFCLRYYLSGGIAFLIHCIFMSIIAMVSFGLKKGWLSVTIVYIALNLSLGGIGYGTKGLVSFTFGTAGILVISFISKRFCDQYANVELVDDGKKVKLIALRDSGNMLSDPVTGKDVLVVDASISQQLTGLSIEQLRSPIECVCDKDGFRLIPYKTISEQGKFLLARKIDKVIIDGYETGVIIGFSPELFSSKNSFQAIIGGQL